MRVIAGTARSIPLKAPQGMETRPTTDKIKETLFNMIQFDLQGAVFLDLFAGSGAMGIEAISRGADRAVFVDSGKAAADCIRSNLEKCRFTQQAKIVRADAASFSSYLPLLGLKEGEKLIVFLDPPYEKGLEIPVLKGLAGSGVIDRDSLVILEEGLKFDTDSLRETGLSIYRIKEYKNQKHLFMRKDS